MVWVSLVSWWDRFQVFLLVLCVLRVKMFFNPSTSMISGREYERDGI
jgi:hypothetical protein